MQLLTAAPADDNTPGRKPEVPSNPTAGAGSIIHRKPKQETLFDVSVFIPEGDLDEVAETYARARVLRDFLIASGGGTFEAAIAWAGLLPLPKGRACVVNCRAPIVAIRNGWAIPSGGICRGKLAPQAHGGRIGHYKCPSEVLP